MGILRRTDFSAGWVPSADPVNAPKNALLRMDNCVLDELGAVALRPGSAKINTSALATPDVHSLFTVNISGTKHRLTGATDAVYDNGTSIATSIAGSGDIAFGAHRGNGLFARSTTKKKYDGTTVRNWGIAAPGAAPTLTGLSADSKTFATCSSAESPGMTSNEGTQTFVPDLSGTANAAVQIAPDTTTGRGTSTLTYGSPVDFTTYSGGGTATDDDLLDLFIYVTEPQYISSITIMIDVNDGLFQFDWYDFTFLPDDATSVTPNQDDYLSGTYDIQGIDRADLLARLESGVNVDTSFRTDKPVANAGWNHFLLPRKSMIRHGLTTGKDWSTVAAIRVTFTGIAGGSGGALRFDEIKIVGGSTRPLTGKFKGAIVAVRNDGTYNALSAPSAFSAEIDVKTQGIRATIDATTIGNLDSQVNELWLFLMGGSADASTDTFYLFTKKTGGPFSGSTTIDATTSIRTAMAADITLDTDIVIPPNSIIGIEGPHYDRTLCLTATAIYPSKRLNPDSFATGEVVAVGDASETALWIKKKNEQLYLGTTRDVYRLDGDWTPQPDGSINVTKHPMNVTSPPISSAIAVGTIPNSSGFADALVYLTGNGWQVLEGPSLVNGAVDLLWKGYPRHGVNYVNITDSTSRFRCAIAKGIFYAITPEFPDTTSSLRVHAYNFTKQRWYRLVYPQAFRSIYTEYDGSLLAGDASGYVRLLDQFTLQSNGSTISQDDSADVPVTIWTPSDDDAQPFMDKVADNFRLIADTGGDTATISFALNGATGLDTSTTMSLNASDIGNSDISAMTPFRQIQERITGSFGKFILRGFDLTYLDAPDSRLVWDTNFPDVGSQAGVWIRFCRFKARIKAVATVTPHFGSRIGDPVTFGGPYNTPDIIEVGFGRECFGRQPRMVVTSTVPFPMWWIEISYNESGNVRQKRIQRFPSV